MGVEAMEYTAAEAPEETAETGCFHCGLDLPRRPVCGEAGGEERAFCCRGCLGVASYIFDSGLEGYYDKRDDSRPGVKPDVFGGDPADPGLSEEDLVERGVVRESDGEAREATFAVEGIHCAACVWLLEKVVGGAPGVESARVNLTTRRMTARWDPSVTTVSRVAGKAASVGYGAVPYDPSTTDAPLEDRKNEALLRLVVAGFATLATMFFAEGLYGGYFWGIADGYRGFLEWMSLAVTLPVVLYSARPFIRGALGGLVNRTLTMDLPIAVGVVVTFGYSVWSTVAGSGDVYFDSVAMFTFLILGGRFIEAVARRRAGSVTSRLDSLRPGTAVVLRGGERSTVPVDSVRVGETVEVGPGSRVPLDGEVLEGTASVDESTLTGESRPVVKRPASEVFGSTINTDGRLLVRVTRTGGDTVISRVGRMAEEAQHAKARIQTLADRAAVWFVPLVLGASALTYVYWAGRDENALIYAVAVLIITCPCALALAVPAAVLAGCGRAAREGIVVRSGAALELARRADRVVFDKTGTLTEGRMTMTDVVPARGADAEDVVSLAAALERFSEHPAAKAVVGKAERLGVEYGEAEGFRARPGLGVEGELGGDRVAVGSLSYMAELGAEVDRRLMERADTLSAQGKSVFFVVQGSAATGLMAAVDPVREGAKETVARLRGMGIRVTLLSGDRAPAAEKVAAGLGIEDVVAEVMPGEKARVVGGYRERGETVVMVGDGINDAPALASSDVALAVGSGTDLAVDSSDVVILGDGPELVVRVIEISRKTFSVIRQNLWMSVVYNAVMTPLAAAGFIVPVVAAVAMPVSSLAVILNSVRAGKGPSGEGGETREAVPAPAPAIEAGKGA